MRATKFSSRPRLLLSPAFVARQGWHVSPAGWWLETAHPLTGAQRALAHRLAADAGVRVELRDRQASLGARRLGATAVGIVLALGILAMTIGLLRSESARDVRTLTAAGAPPRVLRSVTAATAGALATLGVLLGAVGAYVVLVAAYFDDRSKFLPVPVANVAVIVFGVPLLAYAAGWALAGRRVDRLAVSTFD
jgi:putative ABC transport system permease protein